MLDLHDLTSLSVCENKPVCTGVTGSQLARWWPVQTGWRGQSTSNPRVELG